MVGEARRWCLREQTAMIIERYFGMFQLVVYIVAIIDTI